jgi:fibronectin-binding autotransporter adhesin
MANITRIKNNQITDATIEYTKIKSGTLVGSVFNANLTLNSNVTVIGNLSVTGNTSTINSTNTLVNDPLVIFNNGYSGSPSYDIGIIANRNLQSLAPYGSVNMAWIWEETAQQWQAIATTETGVTQGTINNSGFANLRVGNAIVQTVTVSNSVSVGTTLGVTGATTLTGATTFTTATGGGLQVLAIGNVTPGTAQFTTLGASGATTLNTVSVASLQAVAIGNVTAGTGAFTTGTFSSTLGVTGATTMTTASVGGLQAVAIGNATPGTGAFTTLNTSGATTLGLTSATAINNTPIGNATPSLGAFTTLSATSTLGVTGATTLTTATVGGLQAVAIGNVTPGTAQFTTLGASGATTLTTATVGGLQAVAIGNVTPGTAQFTTLGASGATTLNTVTGASFQGVIGNVTSATATFTTVSTGGLQAVAIGNVTPGTGAFTTLTAGTWANVTGTTDSSSSTTGALVTAGGAGIAKNLYVGGSAVISGNLTVQGTMTAIQSTTLDVTDLNITVAKGAANPTAANGAGLTVDGAGATILYTSSTDTWNLNKGLVGTTATFNTETVGGLQAVAIGNVTPGTGAFTTLTTTGTFTSTGNLVAAATTTSTDINTGSFIAKGGVGIAGNLNVGVFGTSLHNIKGNLLLGQGSVGPSADSLLTLNANTDTPLLAAAQLHISAGTGKPGSLVIDSFGTAVSSVYIGRHARGTSATPTAVQLNDQIANFLARGYGSTGYANSDLYAPSGVTIVAAENFTDTAQGTNLTLDVTPTGSNSAVTAVKVASSGNVVVTATTPSIDYTNGALVVKGGAGFNGNIHVNGDVHAGGSFNGSDVAITGQFSTTDTTDTTAAGLGSINLPGGASIGGNTYVGKNLYIGPASFSKNLTTPTIIAVDNGTAYAQMAMMNSASSGSADYAAYADNGVDSAGWVDMGIAGSAFNDPNYTITKPQDGYLITRPLSSTYGGNLVIGTSEAGSFNDLVIGVGSFASNAEVVRFHGNTSNGGTMIVKLPTPNTATANTGAFQVWGGASISGNSYIGGGAIINGSQTAGYDFKAMGKNSTNLLWARPSATYDQVIIGNTISAASLTGGAKLQINSTDSILLPTGTTAQRPSSTGFSDVAGMFRYNTTIGAIEFYSGSTWQSVSTSFTVITDEQYNGDGVTVAFTMAASSTTAATIVSINGVIQIPTLAYSVSGVTLTFTEAPASGDVIDVRRLTTTQTVQNITSTNGYMGFSVDNDGAYVSTGAAAPRNTTYWDTTGAEVGAVANVSVASANTLTTIDTMDNTKYRSAKYLIQVTNGTNFQVSEALVISNGTTSTIVNYGTIQTNGNLGIVTATQSSTNTLVQFVAANSSNQVRIKKTYMLL